MYSVPESEISTQINPTPPIVLSILPLPSPLLLDENTSKHFPEIIRIFTDPLLGFLPPTSAFVSPH